MVEIDRYLSARAGLLKASQVRELLKWIGKDVISLGGGVPDPASFPMGEIKLIVAEILEEKGGGRAPVRANRRDR